LTIGIGLLLPFVVGRAVHHILSQARPHCRQMLPKTATKVAVSGNRNGDFLSPFRVTICHRFGQLLLPFSATIASATICRRFRQLLSPVWTGYNDVVYVMQAQHP